MKIVSLGEVKDRWSELVRQVEQGASITVVENGKPIFDMVPHMPQRRALASGILRTEKHSTVDDAARMTSDVEEIWPAISTPSRFTKKS
jgi:prevent-host-death family protein